MRNQWSKAAAARWKKNVPHDMVSEYLELGWRIQATHQNYTTMFWPKDGAPP